MYAVSNDVCMLCYCATCLFSWAFQAILPPAHYPTVLSATKCLLTFALLMLRNNWAVWKLCSSKVAGSNGPVWWTWIFLGSNSSTTGVMRSFDLPCKPPPIPLPRLSTSVAGVFNLLTPPANSAGGQPVSGTSWMHARRLFTKAVTPQWRHDSVLRIMKRHFLSFWQSTSTQNAITQRANLSSQPYIRFVPAGSVPRRPDRYQTHSETSTIVIKCHLQKHCSSTPMIGCFFLIWATLSLFSPQRLRSPPNGLILSFSLGQKRQSFW